MIFLPDVLVQGIGNKFTYASDKQSMVASDAIVTFDHDVEFKYEPAQTQNKTLFALEDESSTLYLRGARLYADQVGLKLTTGNLFFDDKVTVSSDAQTNDQAIEFGKDVNIKVLSGAEIDVFGRLILDS